MSIFRKQASLLFLGAFLLFGTSKPANRVMRLYKLSQGLQFSLALNLSTLIGSSVVGKFRSLASDYNISAFNTRDVDRVVNFYGMNARTANICRIAGLSQLDTPVFRRVGYMSCAYTLLAFLPIMYLRYKDYLTEGLFDLD